METFFLLLKMECCCREALGSVNGIFEFLIWLRRLRCSSLSLLALLVPRSFAMLRRVAPDGRRWSIAHASPAAPMETKDDWLRVLLLLALSSLLATPQAARIRALYPNVSPQALAEKLYQSYWAVLGEEFTSGPQGSAGRLP